MTTKEIANAFRDLGDLMELHEENPFKIRSYQNAYITLRKIGAPLSEMEQKELEAIKGVGAAIAAKIAELLKTGKMEALEKYKQITPEGIREMLQIKGFGPKKVNVIWKELGAETVGELLYACNENRLIELKGFGKKTQDELKNSLEYFLRSKNKFLYATLEPVAEKLVKELTSKFPPDSFSLVGAFRRRTPVLEGLDLLVTFPVEQISNLPGISELKKVKENEWSAKVEENFPLTIFSCSPAEFGSKQFRYTSTQDFMDDWIAVFPNIDFRQIPHENDIFEKAGLPFIAPELREKAGIILKAKNAPLPVLIEEKNIKGVVHCHTTYSDGLNTLEEMANYAQTLGYEYITISDHSKSAFYANGLKEERLWEQWREIDVLNSRPNSIKIYKSIESDILNDGSLDYPEDILREFDLVIASVHSNLKMDEQKATERILKAVENPFTSILGHPTGRLLLSRKGYPLDHKKIIDACAANRVAIEINANPYRLDLDWEWIPYAIEKGVLLSINPDAHSKEGIKDIRFGVLAARKGGLFVEACLNTKNADDFIAALKK